MSSAADTAAAAPDTTASPAEAGFGALSPAARAIVEAAPDAMVIVDRSGSMLVVNSQVERLFGYDRSELVGRSVETLLPARFREIHRVHRNGYAAEPSTRMMSSRNTELFGARKDGSEFRCEIALSPLQTEAGFVIIAAIRDITARIQAERDRASLAQAEEAVRMRDEFLSIAAHELRTPLTALQLQLQSVERILGQPEVAREQVATKIGKAVRHFSRLNALVNQLLDVTRITSTPLTLSPEEADMLSLVRDVVEDFKDQAERAGCAMTVSGDANARGVWDRFRIEQVLVNLLSNAIKYGAGRPIEVEVASEEHRVFVRVRDHGVGVQPEDVDRIFDRFERGAPAAHFGGLGLGLYIAKQLTESHGGQLRVWSEPGEGATFELELPRG